MAESSNSPGSSRSASPSDENEERRKRRRRDIKDVRHEFDDPEIDNDEILLHYKDAALKREKAWFKRVERIMFQGNSNGHISDQLGNTDQRPVMTDEERQQMIDYCNTHTKQKFPIRKSPDERLPNHLLGVFVNTPAASVDSLEDSAAFLGLDLTDMDDFYALPMSNRSPLRLRIDQVQNVAFMVRKAEGELKGCINGNDCGTGKTIETLAAVYFLAKRKAQQPGAQHKPVIILCPNAAVDSWRRDHTAFFSNLLTLTIFERESKKHILEKIASLRALNNVESSQQICLFTFRNFAGKFLIRQDAEKARKKSLSYSKSKLLVEQLEALLSADKEVLFSLHEDIDEGKFGICIVDEAHGIKHPKSAKSQAQYLIAADVNFLLTASPTDNRVSDLRGLLFALYKANKWQLDWPKDWNAADVFRIAFAKDFDPFTTLPRKSLVPSEASLTYRAALARGEHLWRLNPALYRWLGHQKDFSDEFAERVTGAIFEICLLHRAADSSIALPGGRSIPLSEIQGIPPATINTVELKMSQKEQKAYRHYADWWFPHLYDGDNSNARTAALLVSRNELPRSGFNKTIDWRMRSITSDIHMAPITRLRSPYEVFARDTVLDFDAFANDNKDLGVSFYYQITRDENTDPKTPPASRTVMLRYMLRNSAKMRWLLPKLWEWKAAGEKVVIFCNNALSQWLIERVCLLFRGFKFLSLSSTHLQTTRTKVLADFNNPSRRYDFLLTTFNIAGTSVEIQRDCHKMVIFDLPEAFPACINAVGRIRRVGQQNPQDIIMLTLRDSYDDFMVARSFKKYAVEIGGKAGVVDLVSGLTDARLYRFGARLQRIKWVTLKELVVAELIRRYFGMKWTRLGQAIGYGRRLNEYRGIKYRLMTANGKVLLARALAISAQQRGDKVRQENEDTDNTEKDTERRGDEGDEEQDTTEEEESGGGEETGEGDSNGVADGSDDESDENIAAPEKGQQEAAFDWDLNDDESHWATSDEEDGGKPHEEPQHQSAQSEEGDQDDDQDSDAGKQWWKR